MPDGKTQEIEELKELITQQNQKIDRILTWAEGDRRLGTPSIKMQIDQNQENIKNVQSMAYENRGLINDNRNDVKNLKKVSGAVGGSSGGVTALIIHFFKQTFGS